MEYESFDNLPEIDAEDVNNRWIEQAIAIHLLSCSVKGRLSNLVFDEDKNGNIRAYDSSEYEGKEIIGFIDCMGIIEINKLRDVYPEDLSSGSVALFMDDVNKQYNDIVYDWVDAMLDEIAVFTGSRR